MRKFILAVLLFCSISMQAQKVTGYWYGQANVEMTGSIHNNYLTELIIAQKGNKVKGFFGYYFKDVYQSFLVKGTFNPQTREIIIRDIPIIYFNTNSTINSVDCITSFYGTLMVSKVKTSLTGYFLRDKKYTYTCPDLRVNYTLFRPDVDEDSLFGDVASIKKFWKPAPENYGIVEDETAKKDAKSVKEKTTKAVAADAALTNDGQSDKPDAQVASTTKTSYVPVAASPVVRPTGAPVRQDIFQINQAFKKRKAILGKDIEVNSDSIRLSFYDNAEVDGDSISVFLNGNLMLAHQQLNSQAFNVYVKLDSLKEINEVSMFAENLGKYPPNTALMVVNDGSSRYEVFLSSDFKGNGTIRFKRKKSQ